MKSRNVKAPISKPLLAALWLKAVVAPLEILQRKEFQLVAARQRKARAR